VKILHGGPTWSFCRPWTFEKKEKKGEERKGGQTARCSSSSPRSIPVICSYFVEYRKAGADWRRRKKEKGEERERGGGRREKRGEKTAAVP